MLYQQQQEKKLLILASRVRVVYDLFYPSEELIEENQIFVTGDGTNNYPHYYTFSKGVATTVRWKGFSWVIIANVKGCNTIVSWGGSSGHCAWTFVKSDKSVTWTSTWNANLNNYDVSDCDYVIQARGIASSAPTEASLNITLS